MKISVRIILSAIILSGLISLYSGEQKASAAITSFNRTVLVGSSGEDVRALQMILNQDPATSIRGTGAGSLGHETDYFGSLTQEAVMRFQNKYAEKILSPNGLIVGTGIVGPSTRIVLNHLETTSSQTSLFTATSTSPVSSSVALQNPNLKNIDSFMAALDKVGAQQGLSTSTLLAMKARVMEKLATTTDLRATFLNLVQKSNKTAQNNSWSGRLLAIITQSFEKILGVEHAQAATGAPFGGALLFAMPCDGGVWNIALEPLPPLYPILLAYKTGSQAFLSHNIPATPWLLGEYEPAPAPYCWLGIYPYPSEGMITPVVGSAPL